MKRPQFPHCRSTRRLAVCIRTLAANNSGALPPVIKHQTSKKKGLKKHLARTGNVICMRVLKLLPASQPVWTRGVQPVDTKTNKGMQRQHVLDRNVAMGGGNRWSRQQKKKCKRNFKYMNLFLFYFVSTECNSSSPYYGLSSCLWLFFFIALLMTIAATSTDLLANYIQWWGVKLISNSV